MTPSEFRIERKGRRWTPEESEKRLYAAPDKIEFVAGIFDSDRQRIAVLGMILETFGLDAVVSQFGRLEDWKAAVAERDARERVG